MGFSGDRPSVCSRRWSRGTPRRWGEPGGQKVVGSTARWISGAGGTPASSGTCSIRCPPGTIFQDGDSYYQVALQVPGITRDAPPAPE
ncbi:MAG: hypothetical protein U0521_00260 [Anaerolineae bacterium]